MNHTQNYPNPSPALRAAPKNAAIRKTSGRNDLWKGENTIQERNQKRDFSKVSKWGWVISL